MGNSSRGPGFTLFVQYWEVWIFAIFLLRQLGEFYIVLGCFLFAFCMFGEQMWQNTELRKCHFT